MLLIKNANIHPMTGRPAFHGYLLADPPYIRKVGSGEPPPHLTDRDDLRIIDAKGDWLIPGLIDAHCHVGLFNEFDIRRA